MALIKNIVKNNDSFFLGKLFAPLFDREIDVWIENSADFAYAEKCAEKFISLSDEMIDKFCERSIAYYRYMLEQWGDFSDIYGDIEDEINNIIPENVEGREILKYISRPHLYVFEPEGEGTGYIMECDCVWEPEHQLSLIILDGRVLYVGPSEGLGPWEDESDYEMPY